MAANRPHYHVWLLAATDRIFYKVQRGFFTRQAARQYGARREPDPSRVMVRQCTEERCRPRLE